MIPQRNLSLLANRLPPKNQGLRIQVAAGSLDSSAGRIVGNLYITER
jgi:hypothetical protein